MERSLRIEPCFLEGQALLANDQRSDVVAGQQNADPAARLREARKRKGLSHRQVADATKLSVRAIELLERDCISALPEGIYRRSIVRAVAREVGLNPDQILADFSALHPDALPLPHAAVIVEAKRPSSINKALAFASAVLPVVAGIVYFALPAKHVEPAQLPPSANERRADQARAEVLPVGGFGDTSAASTRPVPIVVTFSISARCHLRIVSDGTEIVSRVMEPGETLPVELGDELLLYGDSASAVQFSINGQAGRMLGDPGSLLSARIGRDDYQHLLIRN